MWLFTIGSIGSWEQFLYAGISHIFINTHTAIITIQLWSILLLWLLLLLLLSNLA